MKKEGKGKRKRADPALSSVGPAHLVIKITHNVIGMGIYIITAVPLLVTMSMEFPCPTVS